MAIKAKGTKQLPPFKQAMANHKIRFDIKEKKQSSGNYDLVHSYHINKTTSNGKTTTTRIKGPTRKDYRTPERRQERQKEIERNYRKAKAEGKAW